MKHHSLSRSSAAGRWGALLVACLSLPGLLLAQPAGRVLLPLSITVDDYRPLAALADELEKRYQIVLTYEEGPWVAATDVEDVTHLIVEANGPGKAVPSEPVIGPRKAAVSFEYDLDKAKGRPTNYPDLLSKLLVQYDAAGAPGKFRFEGSDGFYNLIPSQLKDAAGRWAAASPVLSTPVRLADQERSVDDTLEEVIAQLNQSSPVKVEWGLVPINLFNQTKIRLSADGVPARQVMRQILELLPRRVTWRLNYDPTTKRYYLNFLPLPGGR